MERRMQLPSSPGLQPHLPLSQWWPVSRPGPLTIGPGANVRIVRVQDLSCKQVTRLGEGGGRQNLDSSAGVMSANQMSAWPELWPMGTLGSRYTSRGSFARLPWAGTAAHWDVVSCCGLLLSSSVWGPHQQHNRGAVAATLHHNSAHNNLG